MALQTIVSRNVPALETALVGVGYINGGRPHAPNGMPAELFLGGTLRCFTKEAQGPGGPTHPRARRQDRRDLRVRATANVTWITTPLVNAPDQVDIVARSALGTENASTDLPPITGGQD